MNLTLAYLPKVASLGWVKRKKLAGALAIKFRAIFFIKKVSLVEVNQAILAWSFILISVKSCLQYDAINNYNQLQITKLYFMSFTQFHHYVPTTYSDKAYQINFRVTSLILFFCFQRILKVMSDYFSFHSWQKSLIC